MDSSIIEKLRQLVSSDQTVVDNPTQLGNRLADAFPNNRLEVKLLREALREGVVSGLRSSGTNDNPALVQGRLAKRLEENAGLSTENARWAVEAWAVALGLMKASAVGSRGTQTVTTSTPQPAKKKQQPPPVKPPGPDTFRRTTTLQPPVKPPPISLPPVKPTLSSTSSVPPVQPPSKASGSGSSFWIGAVVVATVLAGAFFWTQNQGGSTSTTTAKGGTQPTCVPRGGPLPLGDWKYC